MMHDITGEAGSRNSGMPSNVSFSYKYRTIQGEVDDSSYH
jgi:hypothetical protein